MNTALLLVDLQQEYFSGGSMPLSGALPAVQAARQLLDACRNLGVPVVHVRHLATRPGATFLLPGTDGAEFHELVLPLPGEPVITKHFPNSFRETGLADLLRAERITELIVCGMMTHMCIDATVRAAVDLGWRCVVAEDACATRHLTIGNREVAAAQVQLAFLAALQAVYAEIAAVADIPARLAELPG